MKELNSSFFLHLSVSNRILTLHAINDIRKHKLPSTPQGAVT